MDTDDSRTSRVAERAHERVQLYAVSVLGSTGDAGRWGDDGSVRCLQQGDGRCVTQEHSHTGLCQKDVRRWRRKGEWADQLRNRPPASGAGGCAVRPLYWLRGMSRDMAEVLLRSLALEARTGAEGSLV